MTRKGASFGGSNLHLQNDLQPDLTGIISRKPRSGFWISGSFSPSIQICSEISFLAVYSRSSEEPPQDLMGEDVAATVRVSRLTLTPQGLTAQEVPQFGCPILQLPLLVAKACSATLNDSDSVAKAFSWVGNGHPLLPFLHSGFLTFKGHFVFPRFPSPACMNPKWIWTKSTRWVVMFPTIICSQGMNILYSKSHWRFVKRFFKNKTRIHSFLLAQEDYSRGKQKYRTSLHSWIFTEWIWICVWGWSGLAVVGTECPLEKRSTRKAESRGNKNKSHPNTPQLASHPPTVQKSPFSRSLHALAEMRCRAGRPGFRCLWVPFTVKIDLKNNPVFGKVLPQRERPE